MKAAFTLFTLSAAVVAYATRRQWAPKLNEILAKNAPTDGHIEPVPTAA